MSNLANFIQAFQNQKGLRGALKRRLFGGLLEGMRAVQADSELLHQKLTAAEAENAALRTELTAVRERLGSAEGHILNMSPQISIVQEAVSPEGAIRQNLEQLGCNMRNNNSRLDTLQSNEELMRVKLTGLEKKLRSAPAAASAQATETDTTARVVQAPSVQPETETDYTAIDYFDFENRFRGPIESVKQAQRIYLPYFSGKQYVLDFGCGRGEFLSLMREEGIPAVGVDVYEPYVDYCNMQGLSAVCGDGMAYLRSLEKVDGIFLGQVAEHLQTEQLTALCSLAYDKLEEGGCLVLETPNPTSLAIYTNAFYLDPSHVRPVHPLTLQYLLQKAGFRNTKLLFTEQSRPPYSIPALEVPGAEETCTAFNEAMQRVSELLYGSQDYAAIAIK
jgi:O-antigen chain-terminating methyltransferase